MPEVRHITFCRLRSRLSAGRMALSESQTLQYFLHITLYKLCSRFSAVHIGLSGSQTFQYLLHITFYKLCSCFSAVHIGSSESQTLQYFLRITFCNLCSRLAVAHVCFPIFAHTLRKYCMFHFHIFLMLGENCVPCPLSRQFVGFLIGLWGFVSGGFSALSCKLSLIHI